MVLPWWETLVLSFHSDSLEEYNESFKWDILRVRELFTRHGLLLSILDLTLKYLKAKYKDELTWLNNKSYISALSDTTEYSVLFIDLDNFKSINDNYWHYEWDNVLKLVAEVLRDSVKIKDIVCRISWDEFVILVPTLV